MRGNGRQGQGRKGRSMIARLIALAFLVQIIGLFVQAPASASSGSAAAGQMVDCPHHGHMKLGKSAPARTGGCPMCQTLGCALPGAQAPEFVALRGEILLGLLRAPDTTISRPAPPLSRAAPRGPPALS